MSPSDTAFEEKKVALVTGGSRGIGRACVVRLARAGFDVGFCYAARRDAAIEVEKEVAEIGARTMSRAVDVSDADAVRAFVAEVESGLGAIDVVVAAAGITRDKPMVMMDREDWAEVLDVNLTGAYNTCRAVVFEMMKRKSGSIVTLSSVAGVYGNVGQTNYAATKAGLIGMTKSMAKEFGRYGIRANVVAPGFIDTDMVDSLPEKVRRNAIDAVPLRRIGTADEVAELVVFLAGEQGSYITGSVMHVDGGAMI